MEETKEKTNEPIEFINDKEKLLEGYDKFENFDRFKKYRNIEKMNYALVQG